MERFLDDADDGVLSAIFSFLSPLDIASCASTCRRLRRLCCCDTSDLWRALCHRRWAEFTTLSDWARGGGGGALGFAHYRGLYQLLAKWGGLIGFWRGVNGRRSQLLGFEWRKNSIQGFVTVPAGKGSYQVRRIPFLWLGADGNGKEICVMSPVLDGGNHSRCGCHLSKDLGSSTGNGDLGEGSSGDMIGNLFAGMDAKRDMEDLSRLGLVLVKIHFSGKNHIVLEELNCQRQMLARKKMSLAEAVASASFGCGSNGLSSRQDLDLEIYGKSPPGSFPYEMYRFLSSKVTSPGSDRAARKHWKREKERAESQGRLWWLEQLHFVKVVDPSPTRSRPLQGLWKGLCRCDALDFMLVSYDDDDGGVVARQVGESSYRRLTWMNLSEENFEQISSGFGSDRDGFRLRVVEIEHSTDLRPIVSSGNLLDVVS